MTDQENYLSELSGLRWVTEAAKLLQQQEDRRVQQALVSEPEKQIRRLQQRDAYAKDPRKKQRQVYAGRQDWYSKPIDSLSGDLLDKRLRSNEKARDRVMRDKENRNNGINPPGYKSRTNLRDTRFFFLREEKGLAQEEIASRENVHVSTVSRGIQRARIAMTP